MCACQKKKQERAVGSAEKLSSVSPYNHVLVISFIKLTLKEFMNARVKEDPLKSILVLIYFVSVPIDHFLSNSYLYISSNRIQDSSNLCL